MYLSTVEVRNFRSLKELRVELQAGLNVLVGRNNTGKTNLLHAIRHALGPSASRGDALWLDRDDFFRNFAGDTTERTISITLTFTGLSEGQRAHFYEIVDFDLADMSKSKAIVRFEASWPNGKRQALIKRTGGPLGAEPPEVPAKLLESLPITFLPALRDAEASLTPGYRSRLALLLRDLAERKVDSSAKGDIENIYRSANEDLEGRPLIGETTRSLQSTTKELAGSDYAASAIRVAEVEFEKILRTLQVQMDGAPLGALEANGLGYNNLLYMAVVLEHLKEPDPDESPLLLIEEPEAHLHPQLTMLLADYLANKTPGTTTPQTIVTTHSPTLAASVPPNRVHVLFAAQDDQKLRCNSVAQAGMNELELGQLQRMMDITRATLYFAKAAILVEGISEALLVPVLAGCLGHDLRKLHISVIPICGVAFETFKKLLNPSVLGIPVAVVSDADPPVSTDAAWQDATPESDGEKFKLSDRTLKLVGIFERHQTVKVFHSKLTLEYDLAEAGDENAMIMAEVWEKCFIGTPGTFNQMRVTAAGADRSAKAMTAWRGICRAKHSGSKAEFAHLLAAFLDKSNGVGKICSLAFRVPKYIQDAIEYVVVAATPTIAPAGATRV
ncbi:MAG: AAA family ATPase [Syntrophobacteraceae bacterium]|jgi:putative ATP-dependent endonuclease of OLD family